MISELVQRTKEFLFSRRTAYCRVFSVENRDAQLVLRDIFKFCRVFEPTFHPDPRISALMEGRKEVALRIQHHLHLDDDTLWALYDGPSKKGS